MPKTKGPLFSKRHYTAVAAILYGAYLDTTDVDNFCFDTLVNRLSFLFMSDNPNFDQQRFLLACNGRPKQTDRGGTSWEEVPYGPS